MTLAVRTHDESLWRVVPLVVVFPCLVTGSLYLLSQSAIQSHAMFSSSPLAHRHATRPHPLLSPSEPVPLHQL